PRFPPSGRIRWRESRRTSPELSSAAGSTRGGSGMTTSWRTGTALGARGSLGGTPTAPPAIPPAHPEWPEAIVRGCAGEIDEAVGLHPRDRQSGRRTACAATSSSISFITWHQFVELDELLPSFNI